MKAQRLLKKKSVLFFLRNTSICKLLAPFLVSKISFWIWRETGSLKKLWLGQPVCYKGRELWKSLVVSLARDYQNYWKLFQWYKCNQSYVNSQYLGKSLVSDLQLWFLAHFILLNCSWFSIIVLSFTSPYLWLDFYFILYILKMWGDVIVGSPPATLTLLPRRGMQVFVVLPTFLSNERKLS